MNQPAEKNNNELTAIDVASYLKNHADFFRQNPDLLLMMELSDQPQGSISLVERQLQGLRQRNNELGEELRQATQNAQVNQHLLQQTISLSMKLIPCEQLNDLTAVLLKQLDELFEIKYTSLLLDNNIYAGKTDLGVEMHSVRKALGDNFPKQQPVCGRLKDSEKNALFNESSLIASAAILPLGETGELGLLALGSEDPSHFDPAMGDLFLLLIADMLSRLLYRYNK